MRRSENVSSLSPLPTGQSSTAERKVMNESAFHKAISVERKRTERSKKPFLLMLVDIGKNLHTGKNQQAANNVLSVLLSTSRETDMVGWYKGQSVAGVVFTELVFSDKKVLLETMLDKVSGALRESLTANQLGQITVSFHLFPDDWDHDVPGHPTNPVLYPDLPIAEGKSGFSAGIKRIMDVLGSLLALILLSPCFLVIALAVRLSSKGPILFRQQRVGYHGKSFSFLKFRSMYVNNDSTAHKEFIKNLIANQGNGDGNKPSNVVYKMTNDPRITPVCAFLRRTSLDEIPQFLNVLKGDMSLVGPLPAIPYEVAAYETWHRRRVLEVKPGITGLWQVYGRSRVKFDDMVRLDIRYAKACSPWLDIKILARTPKAVMSGDGAM